MKKIILNTTIALISFFLLLLIVRGDSGNPIYFQSELDTKLGGPFETSGNNSRYALTKALVDQKTIFFDEKLAKFASPDLVEHDGKFATIFTPGVSFIAAPFYYVGSILGYPQLLTYLSTTLFALLNIFLVASVARKFNVNINLSIISGLIFVFATSALSYANSLTQHHFSTAIILLAILNALQKRTILNNLFFGALVGIGALVDIPNLFFLAPVGIYVLTKHINLSSKLKLKPVFISLIAGVIPFIILFAFYNKQTTGSYTTLSQSIGRSSTFASEETKLIEKMPQGDRPLLPFNTRNQLDGLYILTISNERGIFYYSPILILGVLGLILAYRAKTNNDLLSLIISIILVNLTLYSMFNDPWGGWAFGPRYLIPTSALLSTALAVSLSRFNKNLLFNSLFFGLLLYSILVNTLGATTTSLVPPKVEAQNLSTQIPYTYEYNFQLAEKNTSSSLIYNLIANKYLDVKTYIFILGILILASINLIYNASFIKNLVLRKDKNYGKR